MRRLRQSVLVAAGVLLLAPGGWTRAALPACREIAVALAAVCGERVDARLTCGAPADAAPLPADSNAQQRAFDVFSWEQFVALNWPAAAPGEPDRKKALDAAGPRVWETWKETSEVYLPGGRRPARWAQPGRSKRLFRTGKVEDVLDAAVQPTGADGTLPISLTDRYGRVVRYEIRMNRPAFEYVVARRLYDSRVQAGAGEVAFPDGSVLIKAAWRELQPGEEARYLASRAEVCDGPRCVARTVGLAGFHIMVKTKSAPQWVWATFEHEDNVAGERPSFFDPACKDCGNAVNRQTLPGVPNQVVRATPIADRDPVCGKDQHVDNVAALNRAMAEALAGTPLARYQLIATQRPTKSGTPHTVFEVTPPLLANTTLETFIQPASSCMGCHAMARTSRADSFVSADFTFTLNDAQPVLPAAKPFAPAAAHAALHPRAREISQRTFEMIRPPHVVAKLHCGSCHLNAGTDPKAAWWVGSADRLKDRSGLFYRINHCFRNSMSGSDICGSDADCARNPDMMALVTYIEDLTAAWHRQHGAKPAPSGFPPIAKRTPDPARGKAIYQQKCAFCHGANGEGRYDSNTYYRPALWGPHSFDANAGMAVPELFAAFVHANMPYGSGGELTEQEAWDLAGFVDAQCRPKKPGCPPGK